MKNIFSKLGTKQVDLTGDNMFSGIIYYTIPLILSGVLQLLFNAADLVVVGQFSGEDALAAVGATGALINLIVNVFMGLSVGAASGTALNYGAKNEKGIHRMVHTSMALSIVGGVCVMIIGLLFSKTFLTWMDTPDSVLGDAALYMKIYFIGAPAMMIYNFGAAILRSVGDTARPLFFLTVAGVVNVLLNLVLAGVFSMGVIGVAVSTAVSQLISAILVVRYLMKIDAGYRLVLDKIAFYKKELIMILRVGLPAGIQGSVFAISNVVIQSSVNSFGPLPMSGSTASGNIEGFIYIAMNSFHHTALAFTAQNLGAGKKERIKKIFFMCQGMVIATGIAFGMVAYFFSDELLGIYIKDSAVALQFGNERLQIIALTYFICGMMDVMSGLLRGLGSSFIPMLICLVGACGTRVLWVNTIFKMEGNHTFAVLFRSYPISWVLTVTAQLIFFLYIYRKIVHPKNKEPIGDIL